MTSLYSNQAIRSLETLAIDSSGIDAYELMQRAGQAVFNALLTHWPEVHFLTICCGKGNNAGDGLVVASLAHQYGIQVQLYVIDAHHVFQGPAAQAAQACQELGLVFEPFPESLGMDADVIVDALLGSGLKGEVGDTYRPIIEALNALSIPKVAIDAPSGLNADTGHVQGCAVKAQLTVTFIGLRQGLYTYSGPAYTGTLILNTLLLDDALFDQIQPNAELLNWHHMSPLLPMRARDTHKGDYGYVLIIGGDYGMGGAVRMAGEAAARVGAGLVAVATRPEHVPIVSSSCPELMCHQVENAKDIIPLLEQATVVVIGPGLGKTKWAQSLLDLVLTCPHPKVLDADSLNLLFEMPAIQRDDWVLTPHPGEAARLLDVSCREIQEDRFDAVEKLYERYHGVVVLKGSGTVIKSVNKRIRVCPAGNPGMATGGMGDVLSGVIGGLLAQQLPLSSAAEWGVFIHAMAADKAADRDGERGLLATDLFPFLRKLVNL